jgi:hypothetical protein
METRFRHYAATARPAPAHSISWPRNDRSQPGNILLQEVLDFGLYLSIVEATPSEHFASVPEKEFASGIWRYVVFL